MLSFYTSCGGTMFTLRFLVIVQLVTRQRVSLTSIAGRHVCPPAEALGVRFVPWGLLLLCVRAPHGPPCCAHGSPHGRGTGRRERAAPSDVQPAPALEPGKCGSVCAETSVVVVVPGK